MDLQGIMFSEVRQIETNAVWYHLNVDFEKYNKVVNITKKIDKLTDIESKPVLTSEERDYA